MIDKLRKKIFWIIQISLSVIIVGVIILFASVSYRNTIMSATMFLDKLDGRGEIRENRVKEGEKLGITNDVEGVYRLQISNNNVIEKSDNITDEIKSYAINVSNKDQNEGYIGNYIYKIKRFVNNVIQITLVESEDTINGIKTLIIIAIAIGGLGLIIIYIIAKEISKIIVKPVYETFEKQKQFISDASHELKTPLAIIEANADVLQTKVGENKWITYIQNEVQSMDKLVNDLLTLAKMEKVKTTNYQRFDLSKEVQMSVLVFESMIFEKKIKLETNIEKGIEFNGDKEDIKHIISIILDNAIKHTDENNKIIINTSKEKHNIKIEIKNQGKPIPIEEREKIFERFYRVDKSRNRNEKRYGLGLPIAKGLVEKYGGTIEATSKDEFTIFSVKI